jgi:beta-galactosidase
MNATNVVAVRVFSPGGDKPGGLFDSGDAASDIRSGPFDPAASPGQKSTGYTVSGVGWYRKTFVLGAETTGAEVFVTFEGVYMGATFWLNNQPLGTHPYGYTSFTLRLTPHMAPAGSPNVLSVRVSSMGKNSRWWVAAFVLCIAPELPVGACAS